MRLRAMITPTEGLAALERLVASATSEILLCLTEAYPDTPLSETRLRDRGLETWSDLIAWTARKDVALRILFCEPDPLMSPEAHRKAWAQASGFANVVSRDSQVICAPHGQRAGPVWRTLMPAKVSRAMSALKTEEATRLTPVQRQLLTNGVTLRPSQQRQGFAVADGKTAMLGAFALEGAAEPVSPAEQRLILTDDSDFAAALRSHFGESWNAALDAGAQSLAQRADPFDTRIRAQSRQDLRLMRTFATPTPGAMRLLPEPQVSDLETVLPSVLASARDYVFAETPVLRHAGLVEALANASVTTPELQLVLVMPDVLPMQDSSRDWDASQANALQTRTLDRLRRGFGDRLALVSPRHTRLCGTTLIVDDKLAVLGSYGLSPRSMLFDTGAAVAVRDVEKVTGLMTRLGQHWTGQEDPAKLRRAETWRDASTLGDSSRLHPFPPARGLPSSKALLGLPEEFF